MIFKYLINILLFNFFHLSLVFAVSFDDISISTSHTVPECRSEPEKLIIELSNKLNLNHKEFTKSLNFTVNSLIEYFNSVDIERKESLLRKIIAGRTKIHLDCENFSLGSRVNLKLINRLFDFFATSESIHPSIIAHILNENNYLTNGDGLGNLLFNVVYFSDPRFNQSLLENIILIIEKSRPLHDIRLNLEGSQDISLIHLAFQKRYLGLLKALLVSVRERPGVLVGGKDLRESVKKELNTLKSSMEVNWGTASRYRHGLMKPMWRGHEEAIRKNIENLQEVDCLLKGLLSPRKNNKYCSIS